MKLIVLVSLLLLNTGNCFASQTEHTTIQSVIDAFEHSIKSKDKNQFLSLFVNPDASMVAVVSEEGMVARRAAVEKINREDNKNFVATRTWTSSPNKMINRITSSNVSERESFDNVKVLSDGNIASVYFDYVYYKDDKKQNWGKESWQMVKTLKGWKISSIVYSITFAQRKK